MRLLGVGADADDLGSHLFEDFVAVAEGAGFGGAAESEVPGVKIEDNVLFADKA
jgi:hypothetical protein